VGDVDDADVFNDRVKDIEISAGVSSDAGFGVHGSSKKLGVRAHGEEPRYFISKRLPVLVLRMSGPYRHVGHFVQQNDAPVARGAFQCRIYLDFEAPIGHLENGAGYPIALGYGLINKHRILGQRAAEILSVEGRELILQLPIRGHVVILLAGYDFYILFRRRWCVLAPFHPEKVRS